LSPLLHRRRALATRDRTVALLTIAVAIISRYQAEKDRHGFLDYDDLIDKTLALFSKVSAAWVLYKLDLGIDHLLIDEAQDTSPKQWEVIKHLVSEFTAGEGARGDVRRTIFAVGDEKQSIFSFQGAAPHYFAEMRRHFERTYGDGFVPVDLKHSFRSAPAVLEAVDIVFGRPHAYTGLTADSVKTVHQAVREQAPGAVEIWPLIKPDERCEIEGWDAPFDVVSETSPSVRLAKRIARTIRVWLERGEPVTDLASGTTRPLAPGDVLILVHQRGALFEAIIRALKEADIAVAGADRLMLTEHIAVMDLMALGDALLLPTDDLALATVLKSPLFGLTEEQLFALAWCRRGTLRAALRAKANEDLMLSTVAQQLDRLAAAAASETPFAFYARVLGPEGGRKRLLARLGPEAADALDEFLNLALDYERRETGTLQGFLAWLRTTPTEIKRDMELAREEVRVMTVHGAKGLEAPFVILADTTTNPAGPYPPRLLTIPGTSPGKADRIVWAVRKAMDVPVMAHARARAIEAAQNEYRRLLYVAMTRAADRLVVCGAECQRRRPEGCWYDLVRDALAPDMTEEAADDGDGTVLRLRKPLSENDAKPPFPPAPATQMAIALPAWLRRRAAAQSAQEPTVSASAVGAAASTIRPQRQGSVAAGAETARLRGILVHRLLQALPVVAGRDPGRLAAASRTGTDLHRLGPEALCRRPLGERRRGRPPGNPATVGRKPRHHRQPFTIRHSPFAIRPAPLPLRPRPALPVALRAGCGIFHPLPWDA
ncbi:MAG: UvrD-helicase domain-containing protein, partial [Dehalococcoidia bacterium]|nr:UvrD-helicase domain-containing protein [Dehalococcoidia bacterium]